MSELARVAKIVEELLPSFSSVKWRGTPEAPMCILRGHTGKINTSRSPRTIKARNVRIHVKEGYLVSGQGPGRLVTSVTYLQGSERIINIEEKN